MFNTGAQEFAQGLVFTAGAIYVVADARLDPFQLVMVGTVLEGTVFLFEIPTGIVADVVSRRLSIIVGVALVGIGFIVLGLFPVFGLILLSQVIWGIGYTFTSGATSAWLVDEIGPENVGPIFLRAAQINSLMGAAGVVAAMGIGTLGLQPAILAGGGVFIALAIVLSMVMGEIGFKPAPRENRKNWQQIGYTFNEGAQAIRGRPLLITLVAITVITAGAGEGLDRLFSAHLVRGIGFPTLWNFQPVHWLGLLDLGRGVAAAGVMRLAERWLDMRRGSGLAISLIILTVMRIGLIVGFALASSFAIAAPIILIMSTTRNLRDPLTETWLNQQIDSRARATVLSMNGQADAIGQVVVGPVFGLIGMLQSVRAALLISALALLPTLPLYARALRHASANDPPGETPEA